MTERLEGLDTSSMLNDEDIEVMENIQKVKRHLLSFFKPEAIVSNIKGHISDSDVLAFTNKRAEKFIDVRKPTFIIQMDKSKCLEKYPPEVRWVKEDDEIEWMTECMYSEVIYPFSGWLMSVVRNDESFKGSLDEVLNEIPNKEEIIEMGLLLLSTIFGMRVDKEKYTIHLEYMV
jgi:hypothetical protein